MPHYDVPAHVPMSMLTQIAGMRRCIMAKDGRPVSDNRRWVEIMKEKTKITLDAGGYNGKAEFVTVYGNRWRVTIEEVK